MFSGIIQRMGSVRAIRPPAAKPSAATLAAALDLEAPDLLRDVSVGTSIAVNGVCLTLTALHEGVASFDIIPETWRRTNLSDLQPGDLVNLETSLRAGQPIDGHFVQGHVDGCGLIERIERGGGEYKLWIRVDADLTPYLVRKGSIAVDGVSLTMVDLGQTCFSVALIPTTLERTNLGRRQAGQRVNLETDILARIVVSRLDALCDAGRLSPPPAGRGVTWDQLRECGFVT